MDDLMRYEFDVNLKAAREVKRKADVRKEPHLRKSLVLAYQIQDLLDRNKASNYEQVARWLNFNRARVSQIMTLLFLSPEIQKEILFSDSLAVLGLTEFHIRQIPMEGDWKKQMKLWRSIA
jgi:hypothetical protein